MDPDVPEPGGAGQLPELARREGPEDGQGAVMPGHRVPAPERGREEPGAEVVGEAALQLAQDDTAAPGHAARLAQEGDQRVGVHVVEDHGEERRVEGAGGEGEGEAVAPDEGEVEPRLGDPAGGRVQGLVVWVQGGHVEVAAVAVGPSKGGEGQVCGSGPDI